MEIFVACGKILLETEFNFVPLHRFCYNEYLAMYCRDICRNLCWMLSAKVCDFVQNFDIGKLSRISDIKFHNNFYLQLIPSLYERNERTHRHDIVVKCSVITSLCESNQQEP
jgi:hypothetical protein